MTEFMDELGVTAETARTFVSAAIGGEHRDKYTFEDVAFLAAVAVAQCRLMMSRIEAMERGQSSDRITIAEAVKLSGRSASTIKRLIKTRRIRSEIVNGRRMIERVSFECWFERNLIDVF